MRTRDPFDRFLTALMLVSSLVLTTGCTAETTIPTPSPAATLSLDELVAVSPGEGSYIVSAALLTKDEGAVIQLCDYWLESDPPKCPQGSLVVMGTSVDELSMEPIRTEYRGSAVIRVEYVDATTVRFLELLEADE